MLRLYGLTFHDDRYAGRVPGCLELIQDVATEVLTAGVDVIFDWNHWSPAKRQASCTWAAARGAGYVVHHVATPLEDVRAQLARRNSAAVRGPTSLTAKRW